MGESVRDSSCANGRRRSRRPRMCGAGCLGCNNYFNAKRVDFFSDRKAGDGIEEVISREVSDEECDRKERSLEDIYKNGPVLHIARDELPEGSPYDNLVCKICKKGEGDPEMLICDACDDGFHMYCLCPILIKVPTGTWFCPFCSKKETVAEFPLVQTKIVDFFHIQKSILNGSDVELSSEVRRRRRHSLCLYKKKRRFLPHIPSKDPTRRLQQMASLATALTSTNVEFSDELTYPSGLAPESANQAAFERGGMQVIGKEDLATLSLCKSMCSKGEWPPLMVTHDHREGFVVEADSHIKDLTLIAEYTGDVDYMCNRLQDDSDNLMGLLFPDDPSKELVICPDKRGNIARFISGINNHTL